MTRTGLQRPDAVLLRLRLLGRMEAQTLGNESVLPLGRKTRGLLAILALSGRKPVLRLRLAELLWSRRSEEQARASLRQEIHRLLEALSPVGADVITVDRHMLALKPALTSVDAERILTARVGQADGLPPIEGGLLEELNGTDPALDAWLAAERIRLRDHAVLLFEEMLARQRDPQNILDAARQLLALDGQHERAWLAGIQAHQALGNIALARQFGERCTAALEAGGLGCAAPGLREVLGALGLDQGTAHATAIGAKPENRVLPPATVHLPLPAGQAEPPSRERAEPGEPVAAESPQPLLAIIPVLVLDASLDPAINHFASGLVQTLQSGLVGNGWIRILAGSALQDSLSHGRDDAVLRRRFGAGYVVDGTVQKVGADIRVILRLSDIHQNGQLLWAQRFDGKADSLLALQDCVSAQMTARLPAEIMMAEAQHARRLPPGELDPQRLAAVGMRRLGDSNRSDFDVRAALLRRGLDATPDSPHLNFALGLNQLIAALQRWGDPEATTREAESALRTTIGLDPANSMAVAACAHVLSELRNRPDAALALLERATAQAPHVAELWAVGALAQIRAGRLDEAARFFETYRQLFATHPMQALLDLPEVMIAFLRGHDVEAARLGLLHTELRPGLVPVLIPFLAALGHLHQEAEAARIRGRLLACWPGCTVRALVAQAGLSDPHHAERLRSGLRLAGLEEGGPSAPPASDTHVSPKPRRSRRALGAEPLAG